jgi:LSD1 subclass zinc finger protein
MGETIRVQPLHCAGCGAVVALGQGKTARCGFCRAETPVPEQYAAMQQAARSFAADRQLAMNLYGKVGRPPGRLLAAWGRAAQGTVHIGGGVAGMLVEGMTTQPAIVLVLVAAASYALGFPVGKLIRAVAWLSGSPVQGQLSPYIVLPLAAVLALVLVGVPAVLFDRQRAFAVVRRDIHASLAAALPEKEGGPGRCRNCGAALEVPPGALGVPCSYCRADNLIALPAAWVRKIQSSEFRHFMGIDSALEAYRQASAEAQARLTRMIFAVIFVLPVIMAVAWILKKMKFGF